MIEEVSWNQKQDERGLYVFNSPMGSDVSLLTMVGEGVEGSVHSRIVLLYNVR